MATLFVSSTSNYSTTTLVNINLLKFTGSFGFATATVAAAASQIGGAGDITTIIGGASQNQIVVSGVSINLANVTFIDWTLDVGKIVLLATGGTVTGTNLAEDIRDSSAIASRRMGVRRAFSWMFIRGAPEG